MSLTTFPEQVSQSILFITLDSCRYDSFVQANLPNLKSIGPLYRAMAPGNFTYGSHAAMFVGFTPGVAGQAAPYINPKFGKIFKLVGGGFPGKGTEFMTLSGTNIIDGFKRIGYRTLGTGAVGWFDPDSLTGRHLTQDFDRFYFSGIALRQQLAWLATELDNDTQRNFIFMNIGETHVPYFHEGASWSPEDNPCVPFAATNDADKCRLRQCACLEFVDRELAPLLVAFRFATTIICADHGDCWGEDGLWEHGICHEKVLEVPLVFRLATQQNS